MDLQAIAALAELGSNIALTVLSAQGIVPANTAALATGVEAAVNPLLTAITTGQTKDTDIYAGYGALIGTLQTLKAAKNLPMDVLNKIDEYISAAEAGTAAYLAAQQKYDPSLFVVNPPIKTS